MDIVCVGGGPAGLYFAISMKRRDPAHRLRVILQGRARDLGVELAFQTEVDALDAYGEADLIVASDGINSKIRGRYADSFAPDIDVRPNKFIWLGTSRLFD